MPRKARIDYAGLAHHVMSRTFSDNRLFYDNDDRNRFLDILAHHILETGSRCYAWALMDTHFHLLIKTSNTLLQDLMRPVNTEYARYFNRRYVRRGPIFSDRYKSLATQDQKYLEELVRYIHLNPVRGGICSSLQQLDRYRWCGHGCLIGRFDYVFQDTVSVLKRFGRGKEESIKEYRKFLSEGMKCKESNQINEIVRQSNYGHLNRNIPERWVIGDSDFQREVIARDISNRLSIARYKKIGLTLPLLAQALSKKLGVDPEEMVIKSKRTARASAKMVFCYFAVRAGFPTREVGNHLSLLQASVTNAAKKGKRIAKDTGIELSELNL